MDSLTLLTVKPIFDLALKHSPFVIKITPNQIRVGLIVASIAFVFINSVIFPSLANAQEVNTISDVQSYQISGTVIKVEESQDNSRKLTIQTDQGVKELFFNNSLKLTRNNFTSEVRDIRPNDKVTITQKPSGEVLSAEATSGKLFDFARWALPTTILGLIVLAFITYFAQKTSYTQSSKRVI